MKYMLIEVCERKVEAPTIFETLEAARHAMIERFADMVDDPIEKVEAFLDEDHDPNVEYDYDTYITNSAAMTEIMGENYDWHIFELHDDGTCNYLTEE